MRKLAFFPLLLLVLFACNPQKQGAVNHTIKDFEQSLRDFQMHNIRTENNKSLVKSYKVAAAADVYIANQHVMVLQANPGQSADVYAGLFRGYETQGWSVHQNGNLLMVAEPNTQKEVVDAFMALRW